MAALIRFQAADIPDEGVAFDGELSTGWLASVLGDVRAGAFASEVGRVSGRLSRSGHDIVVRGRIQTAVKTPCVRCLEPAEVHVNADLSLLLQPAARSDQRAIEMRAKRRDGGGRIPEHEFSPRDADVDVYDGETVVLDEFVREAILLEIPNFPLCSESCPGIRPTPFDPPDPAVLAPPAVDPRMAPLGAFRQRLSAEAGEGHATLEDLVAAAAARSQTARSKPILRATTRPHPGRKRKKK